MTISHIKIIFFLKNNKNKKNKLYKKWIYITKS